MTDQESAERSYAFFQAHCEELERNPPAPRWFLESDGEPHAKRYYVKHTRKIDRIDCANIHEATSLVARLNGEPDARAIYESLAKELVRLGAPSTTLSQLEKLFHAANKQ